MNENFMKQLQMLYPRLSDIQIYGDTLSYKGMIIDISSFSVQALFLESKLLSRDIVNMSSEDFFKILSLNKRGLEKKKKDLEIEVLDMTEPIEILKIDDEMFSLRMKEQEFLKLINSDEEFSKAKQMQMNLYYIFLQELKEQENYLFAIVHSFLDNYEKNMADIENLFLLNENQKYALKKWKKLFPKQVSYIGNIPVPYKRNMFWHSLPINGYVSSIFVVFVTVVTGVLLAILCK